MLFSITINNITIKRSVGNIINCGSFHHKVIMMNNMTVKESVPIHIGHKHVVTKQTRSKAEDLMQQIHEFDLWRFVSCLDKKLSSAKDILKQHDCSIDATNALIKIINAERSSIMEDIRKLGVGIAADDDEENEDDGENLLWKSMHTKETLEMNGMLWKTLHEKEISIVDSLQNIKKFELQREKLSAQIVNLEFALRKAEYVTHSIVLERTNVKLDPVQAEFVENNVLQRGKEYLDIVKSQCDRFRAEVLRYKTKDFPECHVPDGNVCGFENQLNDSSPALLKLYLKNLEFTPGAIWRKTDENGNMIDNTTKSSLYRQIDSWISAYYHVQMLLRVLHDGGKIDVEDEKEEEGNAADFYSARKNFQKRMALVVDHDMMKTSKEDSMRLMASECEQHKCSCRKTYMSYTKK